jgi:hypothetical protein
MPERKKTQPKAEAAKAKPAAPRTMAQMIEHLHDMRGKVEDIYRKLDALTKEVNRAKPSPRKGK